MAKAAHKTAQKATAHKCKSGHEVGRLMIQDLVACYRSALEGKGTAGLLDDAEKAKLVNALSTPEDIKRYNEFRYVHEYLAQAPTTYALYEQTAETLFWQLYSILKELDEAERENVSAQWEPRIMTQTQYDRLKAADMEKKRAKTFTVSEAVFKGIAYYYNRYRREKRTPFDRLFTKTKKQPLTNPRIRACFNPWAEPPTAPEDVTMFDVLFNVHLHYEEHLDEFEQDFAELYAAVSAHLEKTCGRRKTYTGAELCAGRVPWAVEWVNDMVSLGFPGGVAVIQPSSTVSERYIDENGDYVPPVPYWHQAHMAEAVLAQYKEEITARLEEYADALRQCFVIAQALRLIGEWIDVPDVSLLVGDVNTEQLSELNHLMKQLPGQVFRYGRFPGERSPIELKQELQTLLRPIEPDSLRPGKAAIAAARKMIDFSTVQGNARKLYTVLMGGGRIGG